MRRNFSRNHKFHLYFRCTVNSVYTVYILYLSVEILDEDIYLFQNYLFVLYRYALWVFFFPLFSFALFRLVCMMWHTMDWPPLSTVHVIKYFSSPRLDYCKQNQRDQEHHRINTHFVVIHYIHTDFYCHIFILHFGFNVDSGSTKQKLTFINKNWSSIDSVT